MAELRFNPATGKYEPVVPGQVTSPPNPMQAPPQQQQQPAQVMFPEGRDRYLSNENTEIGIRNTSGDVQAEEIARAQTGGVDSTESENVATFLSVPMMKAKDTIFATLRAHPEAMQPGWQEWAVSTVAPNSDNLRNLVTPEGVRDARGILNHNYRVFTRNALYMGTGAAFRDDELETLTKDLSPQIGDTPAMIEDKKKTLISYIVAARAKAGGRGAQFDELMRAVEETYSTVSNPSAALDAGRGNRQLSTTSNQVPVPPEMQREYEARLAAIPRGQLTVENYAALLNGVYGKYGPPAPANFGQPGGGEAPRFEVENDPAKLAAFVEAYNKGGGSSTIPPAEVPLSEAGQAHAEFSQSGPGTMLLNVANAGSGGIVEAFDPQAFDDANEQHSDWALAGDVAGSVAPAVAIERLLAKGIGKLAPGIRRRGQDSFMAGLAGGTGYGAARGAADDDMSAAEGALYGAGGELGGRFITGGIRRFKGKRFNDDLERLEDAGVDLTVLQRAGMGRLEEMLGGMPFVRGARQSAQESFNIADANRGLRQLTEDGMPAPKSVPPGTYAGRDTAREVRRILDEEYTRLSPQIIGREDGGFRAAINALKTSSTAGNAAKTKFWREEIAPLERQLFDQQGNYNGNSYKTVMTRLRALEDSLIAKGENQGETWASDMARTMGQLRSQVRALVGRNTPEIAADLKRVEQGWAESVRTENAITRASGNVGVYTPTQKMKTIETLDTSARKTKSARGQALGQEFAESAQRIMGAKGVPDNISFWQTVMLAVPGAAGAGFAAGGVDTILPAIQALGLMGGFAAYTKGIKRFTSAVLSGRRPAAADNVIVRQAVAQYIRNRFQEGSE